MEINKYLESDFSGNQDIYLQLENLIFSITVFEHEFFGQISKSNPRFVNSTGITVNWRYDYNFQVSN